MPDEDRKIKGRVINTYLKFIKSKWGQVGLTSCQNDTEIDLKNINDEMWYPNTHSEKLQKWISDKHGLKYCKMLGFEVATETGVISYFAWMAGIKKVLSMATNEFKRNLTHGKITVNIDVDSKTAEISLKDVNRFEAQCATWVGIFEGVLHITKNQGKVTKLTCELKGEQECLYQMTWE
jgi:hypothetical protein